MGIKYSTENKKKYFFVKSRGESNGLNEVSSYAREIAELCKEQGLSNVLVDETDRQYVLGEVLDHIRFLETTANNRGMNLKFFIESNSAERWLL